MPLEKARAWLARQEARHGFRVGETELPLPLNTQIDYVDYNNPRPTKKTLMLSPETPEGQYLLQAVEQSGKKPMALDVALREAAARAQSGSASAQRRATNRKFLPYLHNAAENFPIGTPYFPVDQSNPLGAKRTSGVFKVLAVAVEFPGWRDRNPTGMERHDGSTCALVGLDNPTWNDFHPPVRRIDGNVNFLSNVTLRASIHRLLLDTSNPFSLASFYLYQSHGNVTLSGNLADVHPWIGSGHPIIFPQPPNFPIEPHGCHTGEADLSVVTFNTNTPTTTAIKPLLLFGPNVRLKTYCYYTHDHEFAAADPYQMVHISQDNSTPPNDVDDPADHRIRPAPYDHDRTDDLDPNLANAGVPAGFDVFTSPPFPPPPPPPGQASRHSSAALVRDVSQLLIDNNIVFAKYFDTVGNPANANDPPCDNVRRTNCRDFYLDTADFTGSGDPNRHYDLLVVLVPQQADGTVGPLFQSGSGDFVQQWTGYSVLAPIMLPPLPQVPEAAGNEADVRFRNTNAGSPAAPAVNIPSMVLPVTVGLETLIQQPAQPGGGLWTTAHLLGHAFGFVDLDDQAGLITAGVMPYTVMTTGLRGVAGPVGYGWVTDRLGLIPFALSSGPLSIRLDPYHKIKAGWVQPFVITTDTLGISLPEIEGALQNPVILKIPADFNAPNGPEYFLVENHNRTGSDPLGFGDQTPRGLYVWHIDERFFPSETAFQSGNDDESNYFVGVIQADGLQELQRFSTFTPTQLLGDPFPGSVNNRVLNQFPLSSSPFFAPTTRFNPTPLNNPPNTPDGLFKAGLD
ncbi:MAG: hypothetical protein NZT92_20900, partial [Abditibacteriales bacterium]|nr:hypothetical protein [Abditibacteriales bacterium]MDW8368178.1 hypothetical protein [Abditibacteriales bacterium]